LGELYHKENTPVVAKSTPEDSRDNDSDSSTYSTSSSTISKKKSKPKKKRNIKTPITRGVFISTAKSATSIE